MSGDTLEALAERADAVAAKFREPASFELVRACLNEAGVIRARRAVDDALDAYNDRLADKREADSAEREAKAALDAAELDADWLLTAPETNEAGAKLLADDKKAWKKREARKDAEVVKATAALRAAEHRSAEARDAVTVADKRFKANCADLDAAVAVLNALREALPARKADR